MENLLIRYAHFIGIILLSSMLMAENILIGKTLKNGIIKKLTTIDAIYGVSAIVIFTTGMLLWLHVGKPKEFYSSNAIFHAKMGLFVLIALLSILPTVFFMRHRKHIDTDIQVPFYIVIIKRLELVILFVLPLLAVLMANGIGYKPYTLWINRI